MKKTFFAALLLTLTLTSCGNISEKIVVEGIKNVEMRGLMSVALHVGVDNRSAHNLRVDDGSVTVSRGDTPIFEVVMDENIRVAKRTEGTVAVPLSIKVNNPLAALSSMRSFSRNPDSFTVTGSVMLRAGLWCKKVKVENMPFPEFIRIFGLENEELDKLIKQI